MFEPLRVLVVDDEDGSRLRVVQSLTSPGVQVDAASTATEALLRAQACGDAYHVAVISQMAGTSATIEAMQRLREVSPTIEFILLTDPNDVESTQRAIEQGAYQCLEKPVVNIEQLRICAHEAAHLGMERRVLDHLVRAGQRISSAQTEEDLWGRVHTEARELLLGLETFIVSDWDELNETVTWPYCVERGRSKPLPPRSGPPIGITEYVIKTRKPLLLPQGDEAFRQEHGLAPSHLAPSRAEIVAPMFLGDKVVGTLSALTYDPAIRYTYNDLRVLQTLANQAAVAAQSVSRRREMAKLCVAAVELAGQRESVAVQREIVKEAHNLIQPDFTGLVLQSEDGRLHRARPVVPEESSGLFGEPRQDGVSSRVVDTGQPYIQEDAQADPNVSDSMKSLGIQSILAVPLSYKGKVLGVLWFNSLRKRQFSDHDVNLCTTFAAQASAALWSISTEEQEFTEIQRKLLAGMTQVCQGFRQWQDTQVLVDTIAQAIVSTFGVDVCSVLEYDPQKGLFTARGAAGLKKKSRAYTPPKPRKFKALFLEKRDPTWVPDVEHDEYWQNHRFVKSQGIKSLIAYPLWMENEPLGILFADYRTFKEFDAGERERLDLFAELASTVLREGRMRDRLRKSQERMAKSQFFNWMSLFDTGHRHDVNQWADSIRQRAGLLRRRLERSTTNELAELIEKDIEVIDTLAAKIRSEPLLPSQPRTDPELLSLYDLLKNAAGNVCGPSVQGPSPIEVSCDTKALSRAKVWGNSIALSSALSKLLQNARNAMPMGGRITVSGRLAEPWARVRICDEGQGIPDEIQNRLFKEVIPRRPGDTGYGIGALWAANVIEDHGGGIKIESTGPGGTVILLWLPTGEKSKQ